MIIELTEIFISLVLNLLKGLFNDLRPLIFLIIGLYFGFFIIEEIVEIIRHRLEIRAERIEEERKIKREAIAPILRGYREFRVREARKEIIKEA